MDSSNTNATSSTSAASPSSPSDNKKTTDSKKAMVTVHMHTPNDKVETFTVRRSDTAASLLSTLSEKSGIDLQHLKVNYADIPFPSEGPEKTLEANRVGPNTHLYCYGRAEEEKVVNGRTRYVRDAKEQGEERRKLFGSTGKAQ